MSDIQPIKTDPPPCPMCTIPTVLKKMHRHDQNRIVLVFKCGGCALEYPVLTAER